MARDALMHQRIAVLRAVATCIAEDAQSAAVERPRVRIYEEAPPRPTSDLKLGISLPRDAFWAAADRLRPRGMVERGPVYEPHRGPGDLALGAWDRALSTIYALARYVELGYPIAIDRGAQGMRGSETIEAAERVLTVRVNMHVFDGLANHLAPHLDPAGVRAPEGVSSGS